MLQGAYRAHVGAQCPPNAQSMSEAQVLEQLSLLHNRNMAFANAMLFAGWQSVFQMAGIGTGFVSFHVRITFAVTRTS